MDQTMDVRKVLPLSTKLQAKEKKGVGEEVEEEEEWGCVITLQGFL